MATVLVLRSFLGREQTAGLVRRELEEEGCVEDGAPQPLSMESAGQIVSQLNV